LGATFAFTSIFTSFIRAANLQNSYDNALLLKVFAPVGFMLIAFAVFETLMTFCLIKKDAVDPQSKYEPVKYFKGYYLRSYINKTRHPAVILNCIIGLSVFWAINQVLLASYGAFLKDYVGQVSVLFAQGSLAMGGVGLLLGALYAGKVSKGFVETGLIPVAMLGSAAGLFILPHLTNPTAIVLLFLAYGFFGGMLIVPLNALIQFNAPRQEMGKILSANNFLQNCFMLGFLVITALASLIGISSKILLYGLCVIACLGAIFTLVSMPQSLIRYGLYFISSRFYRVNVYQLDNLPSSGGVLLLGNHVSFVDWIVLQIACPRPIRFVMERSIYEIWYLNWIFKKCEVIPIARGASQDALIEINLALNAGEVVCLFPEGRLTKNGQLGVFRSGFERSAMNADALIIPFYIHGLWGAKASYSKQAHLSKTFNRRVSIVFGSSMDILSNAQLVKQKVTQLSIKAWKYHINEMGNLQSEWLRQAKKSANLTAIIDEDEKQISNHKLLGCVLYLSRKIKALMKNEQHIGLLLPTSAAGIIANLSVLIQGKTIVNLNFTAGEALFSSAIQQAAIHTIITSRLFLTQLEARNIDINKLTPSIQFIYLEDFLAKSKQFNILVYALLARLMPAFLIKALFIKQVDINSTAAILFSSGSESSPKGIELTHANILSNIHQVATVFGLEDKDVMMNSLPLFHAFGLTVTTLMPLLVGMPMVCCPDPTKSLLIAKLICKHRATVFCSTSSLLSLYTRNALIHRQLLASLRIVVAGAEKLSPVVSKDFKEKFNLEIYEGYGATEVAPVASCNLPDVISTDDWHVHIGGKSGSVGLPLPGCAFRVVDPLTLEDLPIGEDGLVLIGGTQVMAGYLNLPEKTREVLIQDDNFTWYKTGDKGHLDNDGFLTIVDRYSRFAKIAGEMISLSQVELEWLKLINQEEIDLMALALPNDKKGEELALIYNSALSEEDMQKYFLASTIPKLILPRQIKKVKELPKLGNGKRDYLSAKQMLLTSLTEA
ncbi:MAG: MFS transporter, partial [Tatlockia sp.]|nr:MFS transporter [Tatlockia sp.]